MKFLFTIAALVIIVLSASAQKYSYVTASIFNTQNAMPFGKFSALVSGIVHPGIEIGYGKTFRQKEKHYWYEELKIGYFYHRYVQHGIPLYIDFGYSHIVLKIFSLKACVGAGYMHSIPAVGKFKLNSNGEYKNNKGIGRMQGIATFGLGLEYKLKTAHSAPLVIFTNYQQRIQFPFVKSYVPLLPYNSLMLGIHLPIKR